VRRIELEHVGEVVLADTVGFVRALPHELVAAFRSTLQEARDADLLLHVVDASDPQRQERIGQVREVLSGIGAGSVRELIVFNKIDAGGDAPHVVLGEDGIAAQAWVSAVTGAGLPALREGIAQAVRPNQVRSVVHLGLEAAALRSDLYRRDAIREERQCDDGSWDLTVELESAELEKLLGGRGVGLVDRGEAGRRQRVA
jgi:GTP-binding protein HflX